MIYVIVKHSGEYEDRYTQIVSYSKNKELVETMVVRLNEQRNALYETFNKIKKLDITFGEITEPFYYQIEQVKELKNDYIEVEYNTED